jgi:nucleotide-binding universal stress UspA family protein
MTSSAPAADCLSEGMFTGHKESEMRVLLGVDGSQASDRAASLVANLAWPVGSTIDVLTAHPGPAAGSRIQGMLVPTDLARERENAVEVAAQGIADEGRAEVHFAGSSRRNTRRARSRLPGDPR